MSASPTTPRTPEHITPRRVAMTRSFTVPPKLTVSTRTNPTPEIGAADGIETLYVHPSASIIKFNTGGSRPGSSSGSPRVRNEDGSGTLPWAYPTESTVAVGPMEIYRVPGSVSFLHSGALLHAILPRSQCWCVDGVSKFAFRVLPDTYYRIELPGETEDDLELVEALKVTFKKVLFYERTPCPFARGFTVELPKEEVKLKKRNSVRDGPAKKWRLEKTYSWKPEGWEEEKLKRQLNGTESQSGSGERSEASGEEEEESSDDPKVESQEEQEGAGMSPSKSRPRAMSAMRSVTAPPQLQAKPTIPSRVRSRVQAVENVDRAEKAEKVRFSDQVQRRSSVRAKRLSSIPIDLPPSPPDSSTGAETQISEDMSNLDDVENSIHEIPEEEIPEEREPTDEDEKADEAVVLLAQSNHQESLVHEQPTDIEIEDSSNQSDSQSQTPPGESARYEDESQGKIEQYDEDSLPRQLAKSSLSDEDEHDEPDAQEPSQPTTRTSQSTTAPLPTPPTRSVPEDPYAAIQARIQARRSIGGTTTSFHPVTTRKSNPSIASSISVASQQRPKQPSLPSATQRNQSITAALVNKACAVFLGPPAHLVTMMLRIAARFSSGAFGVNSMFFVESPVGSSRRVPGSFYLEDEEDRGWKSDEEEDCWDEDDFGVPLNSPVRISGLRERARREGWEME